MNALLKFLLVLITAFASAKAEILPKTLWLPPQIAYRIVFSPDEKIFVTQGGVSNEFSVWDAKSGVLMYNITCSFHPKSLHFIQQENHIAIVGGQGELEIRDIKTGELYRSFRMSTRGGGACFSRTTNLVAYAFGDVEIWDIEKGILLRTLKGFYMQDAYFNDAGDKVVTSGYQGTKVWDVKTGALDAMYTFQTGFDSKQQTFISFEDGIPTVRNTKTLDPIAVLSLPQGMNFSSYYFTIKFDASHNYVYTTVNTTNPNKYQFLVWDAHTGALLRVFEGHEHSIVSIDMSPKGDKIITAGNQESDAKVWDVNTGQMLFTVKGHPKFTTSAMFTAKGDKILTVVYYESYAENRSLIKAWDVNTGQFIGELLEKNYYRTTVILNQIADRIVLQSIGLLPTDRMTIDVWDNQEFQKLYQVADYGSRITCTSLDPNSKKIAVAFNDSTVRVLNSYNGDILCILKTEKDYFTKVSFSKKGDYVLTVSDNKNARVWDAKTGELVFTVKRKTPDVKYAEFGAEDNTIITVHDDLRVRIYDFVKMDVMRMISGYHTAFINTASFNKQGNYILTTGSEEANIWRGENAEYVRTLSPNMFMSKAFFSPKGNSFITFSKEQWDEKTSMNLWDVESGERLAGRVFSQLLPVALFSNSGDYFFAGDNIGEGILMKTPQMETQNVIPKFDSKFASAAFNSSDSLFAVGLDDGSIRVWNVKTGELLHTLKGHNCSVSTLDFDCCRNILYSSDGCSYVKRWVLDSTEVVNNNATTTSYHDIISVQNPVSNELTLHMSGVSKGSKNYSLYNYLGAKVLSGSIVVSNFSHTIAVDFLPQGIYFFTLEDNETPYVEKFTIIR